MIRSSRIGQGGLAMVWALASVALVALLFASIAMISGSFLGSNLRARNWAGAQDVTDSVSGVLSSPTVCRLQPFATTGASPVPASGQSVVTNIAMPAPLNFDLLGARLGISALPAGQLASGLYLATLSLELKASLWQNMVVANRAIPLLIQGNDDGTGHVVIQSCQSLPGNSLQEVASQLSPTAAAQRLADACVKEVGGVFDPKTLLCASSLPQGQAKGGSCSSGQALQGFDQNQNPICLQIPKY